MVAKYVRESDEWSKSGLRGVLHQRRSSKPITAYGPEEQMTLKDLFKTHRTWEDGVGLTLGLMIGLSPWSHDEPVVPAVVLNSALIGLAVLALAQLELVHLRRWEEIAQLACGLSLSASPFIFHYAHRDHLRLWHWVLGAVVSCGIWQDWNRRDLGRKEGSNA